jgi:preprotein translocase subunit SecE
MAVADVEKPEKAARVEAESSLPGWLSGAFGWGPRKLRELKTFLAEVRAELKKVTWPGRREVYATTVVVVATTFFFGFYLWGLDLVFSRILSQVLKR